MILVQVALATDGCTNDVCCRGFDACPYSVFQGLVGGVLGPSGQVVFGSDLVQKITLIFSTKRLEYPLESTSTSCGLMKGACMGASVWKRRNGYFLKCFVLLIKVVSSVEWCGNLCKNLLGLSKLLSICLEGV